MRSNQKRCCGGGTCERSTATRERGETEGIVCVFNFVLVGVVNEPCVIQRRRISMARKMGLGDLLRGRLDRREAWDRGRSWQGVGGNVGRRHCREEVSH